MSRPPDPSKQGNRGTERNLAWTNLPPKNLAPTPPVPFGYELDEKGTLFWIRAWESPESTQWGPGEREMIARRAQLEDIWQRNSVNAGKVLQNEDGRKFQVKVESAVLTEMRHLDTALGRTPKARRELRWMIDDEWPVVEDEKPKKTRTRDHLKVV